jgi:hypothetical protein
MARAAVCLIVGFALAAGTVAAASDAERAWEALRGDGHVALIRHASAPGAPGDPAGFRLDDCNTQRNLSEQGRSEARALGDQFRLHKVRVGRVVSSQWCRCRETAELMNIGHVEDAPTFNNAYRGGGPRDKLTAGAHAVIAGWRGPGTLVVATHGQNILGLLGFHPAEGEVVVVAPDPASENKMRLIGRIAPGS